MTTGLGKGKKACTKCGTVTGPRAYMCKKCNTPFAFKVKGKEARNTKVVRDFHWKDLVKGERIKVNGGPYYVSKSTGDFVPMGYRGRFVVEGLDENGIKAWGVDKHQGFCHIYMGPDFQNKETGIWKTKHKIIKLKPKVVESDG